jgi:hypothetical protein
MTDCKHDIINAIHTSKAMWVCSKCSKCYEDVTLEYIFLQDAIAREEELMSGEDHLIDEVVE